MRAQGRAIWQAGVEAVQPERCLSEFFDSAASEWIELSSYDRIHVVGAGKAGAAMSRALETILEKHGIDLHRVAGIVNVPNETVVPLRAIRLHPARPAGTNHPTEAGIEGTQAILDLVGKAGPDDLLICLISGGGSALLPSPVAGITLADKQAVTALLHRCGATIQEMNAIRKHLSRVKGGGLIRDFHGRRVLSLIISDVIGNPLDVIASGPTCVDPTTFADALAILEKYELTRQVPSAVLAYIRRGTAGQAPETLKRMPLGRDGKPLVEHVIVADNQRALQAAQSKAEALGYRVMNLGSFIEGETRAVAEVMASLAHGQPRTPDPGPRTLCILSGGETTVTLGQGHGLGGRNQEFVLAFLHKLGREGMAGITVLSGGTDGEDGPTDAAGAVGDAELLTQAEARSLRPAEFLARHDAYHFFEPLGGLLKTGLTHTNVMDLRVILVSG